MILNKTNEQKLSLTKLYDDLFKLDCVANIVWKYPTSEVEQLCQWYPHKNKTKLQKEPRETNERSTQLCLQICLFQSLVLRKTIYQGVFSVQCSVCWTGQGWVKQVAGLHGVPCRQPFGFFVMWGSASNIFSPGWHPPVRTEHSLVNTTDKENCFFSSLSPDWTTTFQLYLALQRTSHFALINQYQYISVDSPPVRSQI